MGTMLWFAKMALKLIKILDKLGFVDASAMLKDLLGSLSTTAAESTTAESTTLLDE